MNQPTDISTFPVKHTSWLSSDHFYICVSVLCQNWGSEISGLWLSLNFPWEWALLREEGTASAWFPLVSPLVLGSRWGRAPQAAGVPPPGGRMALLPCALFLWDPSTLRTSWRVLLLLEAKQEWIYSTVRTHSTADLSHDIPSAFHFPICLVDFICLFLEIKMPF